MATRSSSHEPAGSRSLEAVGQEHRSHALAEPLEREQRREVLHPGRQLVVLEEHAGGELEHEHDG